MSEKKSDTTDLAYVRISTPSSPEYVEMDSPDRTVSEESRPPEVRVPALGAKEQNSMPTSVPLPEGTSLPPSHVRLNAEPNTTAQLEPVQTASGEVQIELPTGESENLVMRSQCGSQGAAPLIPAGGLKEAVAVAVKGTSNRDPELSNKAETAPGSGEKIVKSLKSGITWRAQSGGSAASSVVSVRQDAERAMRRAYRENLALLGEVERLKAEKSELGDSLRDAEDGQAHLQAMCEELNRVQRERVEIESRTLGQNEMYSKILQNYGA